MHDAEVVPSHIIPTHFNLYSLTCKNQEKGIKITNSRCSGASFPASLFIPAPLLAEEIIQEPSPSRETMTVPARAHLPASPAQKPANHIPSIRPGRSTPAPARPPPPSPSPSRVTMTVPARAHLSASPAPNPYNQLSFMRPGRSTPPPAPPRLPASATRPVATGAPHSKNLARSPLLPLPQSRPPH